MTPRRYLPIDAGPRDYHNFYNQRKIQSRILNQDKRESDFSFSGRMKSRRDVESLMNETDDDISYLDEQLTELHRQFKAYSDLRE